MKHDLTTKTWQDDTGCPISIVLAATSDATLTFLALSAAKCASTLVDRDDLVRPSSHCFPHLLF